MAKLAKSEIQAIFSKRMLITLLHGFSSGVPLLLVGSTLQAWMSQAKVDLTVIGIFTLVGLPYTLKFLWAPLLDRYATPFLGRRRGWLVIAQVLLMLAIGFMGLTDPAEQTWRLASLAFLVSFLGATQDILIDAYRREILPERELGLGSALYVIGYRVATLITGGIALVISMNMPWPKVYGLMACLIFLGIVATVLSDEPKSAAKAPSTLRESVIEPFLEFFRRSGTRSAMIVLVFILVYKVGDSMASAMTMPYYLEIGYSREHVGWIVKSFGMLFLIVGALTGGFMVFKIGIVRSLWIMGILQAASTACFPLLQLATIPAPAAADPNTGVVPLLQFSFADTYILLLGGVIAFENITAAMGTSAFIAFMGSMTNTRYTATQYALLTSLMAVPRVVLAAPTGWMAKTMGWPAFFIFCALIALPGLLLIPHLKKGK
ncbi:MAG: AmpG family muropeptide MFS transporter [Bdellovibrionales bacterium]|nr:AmpG family muropeptide MFS transporter [Bdellovibrionales bacterium]